MHYISQQYPIKIQADEGYCLTNGEVYSTFIILGKLDSVENWTEVPLEEVPHEDGQSEQNSIFE